MRGSKTEERAHTLMYSYVRYYQHVPYCTLASHPPHHTSSPGTKTDTLLIPLLRHPPRRLRNTFRPAEPFIEMRNGVDATLLVGVVEGAWKEDVYKLEKEQFHNGYVIVMCSNLLYML